MYVLSSDMKMKHPSFFLVPGDLSSHQTTSTTFKLVAAAAIVISVLALVKLYFSGGVCRSKARLDGKVTKWYQCFIKKLILPTLKVQETLFFLQSVIAHMQVDGKLLAFHHHDNVLVLWVKNSKFLETFWSLFLSSIFYLPPQISLL